MNDMSQVIIPKSDQLNAEDFLARPLTYTIATVEIRAGTEQPVSIFMEGEPRAWRPCKSMSRVLVAAWGPDANAYIGRSVTLYCDPRVKWGGMEVGGIRVSHMSHIEREMLLQLTATKGKRAPHIVKPLVAQQSQEREPKDDPAQRWAAGYLAKVREAATADELNAFANSKASKLAELANARPDLHRSCVEALDQRRQSFPPTGGGFEDDAPNDGTLSEDNPTAEEGPAAEDRGEAHTGDVFDELEANRKPTPGEVYLTAKGGIRMAKTPALVDAATAAFDEACDGCTEEQVTEIRTLAATKKRTLGEGGANG